MQRRCFARPLARASPNGIDHSAVSLLQPTRGDYIATTAPARFRVAADVLNRLRFPRTDCRCPPRHNNLVRGFILLDFRHLRSLARGEYGTRVVLRKTTDFFPVRRFLLRYPLRRSAQSKRPIRQMLLLCLPRRLLAHYQARRKRLS
jgi:hypothetical protein